MIYRHVFTVGTVLQAIRREVQRAWFVETGGPLVGYVSVDDALVVTHAGGPGPRAVRQRHSVLIDGRHAQVFCDTSRRESAGRLDYVGDWHRHPGWSLAPSRYDVEAMQTVARFEHCPIRNPVSLIYRRWPEKYTVFVLDDEGNLVPAPCTLIPAIPS